MSPVQEVIVDGKLVGTKEEIAERAMANKKVRARVVDTLSRSRIARSGSWPRASCTPIAIEDPSLAQGLP